MKKKYRNRLPKGAEVKGYIAHVENGEIISTFIMLSLLYCAGTFDKLIN